MARSRQVAFSPPTQLWFLLPDMSLGQRPQQAPSPARPQAVTLTSFLSSLPTAVHYHILLALPPKQTSLPPLCSPSHDSISAPYLSTSPLEPCLCASPPICPPHQVILPKYKPDHVILLLNIRLLPTASGSSPSTRPSLSLQPHSAKRGQWLSTLAKQFLQLGMPFLLVFA